MQKPQELYIRDFNYELPAEKIAQYPLEERSASKLLIYKDNSISDSVFENIPDIIPKNSFLVLNNTKVIQARLHFHKSTCALIEIFCLEPHHPELNLNQKTSSIWKCFVGNVGKWKHGKLLKKFIHNSIEIEITAEILEREKDYFIVKFEWNNENIELEDILRGIGETPLPPYIRRETRDIDKNRYQTVYAEIDGSVAAPTAGLHFTDKILKELIEKDIDINHITLNVGAGTFKPVKCEKIIDHSMHYEKMTVSKDFLIKLQNNENPVIAVGTTTLRTIESLYWLGIKLSLNAGLSPDDLVVDQWDPYTINTEIDRQTALNFLIEMLNREEKDYLTAETGIIIAPGYDFKFTDILVTNFHLPKSTLLLLIAAFTGNDWKNIYEFALNNNFRFLSYGDSSILYKQKLQEYENKR
jgi:S-adenosylmethionine:tRNA ribosyltransferase-isomerase